MKLRSIEFVIEEAFTGIKRNGLMAFASISTTALSLSVLGAFLLLAMGATNFSSSQLDRFAIAVFVKNANKSGIEAIAAKIRAMDEVTSVEVRDRDKEWAAFKRRYPNIESAGLPRDVLPYRLDVRGARPERLPMIAAKIRVIRGVDRVNESREMLGRVIVVARVVKALSFAGVLILLITTVFIISNAIKLTLYARRREIRIMQLVGATNQTIRMPLVVEGVVFGAAGALAAWVLITAGSSYLSHVAKSMTQLVGQFSSGMQGMQLATLLLCLGGAIGAAGSFVSIRRFLRD